MPLLPTAVARAGLLAFIAALGWSQVSGLATVEAAPAANTSGTRPTAVAGVPASMRSGWRKEMLASINSVRAAAGARPLRPCPALRRSAQTYAALMSTRDYYGHVGPDGSQPGERMVREGYRWRAYGENIAAGQRSAAAVMADWIASVEHYANLVNPAYRHVGLGHASTTASVYGDYWVQDFGRGRGC